MYVIDPGHRYLLDCLDGPTTEHIRFVKRVGLKYPGNEGAHPGTTTQEVLRALINRSEYVNRQEPCLESEQVIGLLKTALVLLEIRASRKKGLRLHLKDFDQFNAQPIGEDGHI